MRRYGAGGGFSPSSPATPIEGAVLPGRPAAVPAPGDRQPAIHKIAFIGAPGAGKTTSIGAVSDCPPVVTDVPCSDDLAKVKATTTVAMDYGEIRLGRGERVLLYGLPGQTRFRFMFDCISKGLLGVVVLVDAQADDVPGQLRRVLADYGNELHCRPCVVALNKCPPAGAGQGPETPQLLACQQVLRRHRLVVPLLSVDARSRADVALLLKLLLLQDDHAPVRAAGDGQQGRP